MQKILNSSTNLFQLQQPDLLQVSFQPIHLLLHWIHYSKKICLFYAFSSFLFYVSWISFPFSLFYVSFLQKSVLPSPATSILFHVFYAQLLYETFVQLCLKPGYVLPGSLPGLFPLFSKKRNPFLIFTEKL